MGDNPANVTRVAQHVHSALQVIEDKMSVCLDKRWAPWLGKNIIKAHRKVANKTINWIYRTGRVILLG